jgi:hypothetical protein
MENIENLEIKLQELIIIPYNHFIRNLSSCNWTMIVPNKRGYMLEKNRSEFIERELIKETYGIKKWIERIKAFCPQVFLNGEILTGICLEAIYVVCEKDFLKNSYVGIINKKYDCSYFDLNRIFDKSIRLEYEKKNEEVDYTVVKFNQKYYFITFLYFNIISFKEVHLNEKKIDVYKNYLEISKNDGDLISFIKGLSLI